MASEHICPECHKTMATAGGLEVHMEMAHAAPGVIETPVALAAPARAPARAPTLPRPEPTGDATAPLAWVLVILLFLGSVAAAIADPAPLGAAAEILEAATPPAAEVGNTPVAPEEQPPGITPAPEAPPSTAPPAAPAAPVSGSQCSQTIASISAAPAGRNNDVGALIHGGTLPPLPVPGHEHPVLSEEEHILDAVEYADRIPNVDPQTYYDALAGNGFRVADRAQYDVGDSTFGAESIQFSTSAGAMGYHRSTLTAICQAGAMRDARQLPGLQGGVAYIYERYGSSPYRAVFIAGDTVVHLRICSCVASSDNLQLVSDWAQSVARQVGAA